jgi:molybdenum cofactor guanylyltransferase
MQTKPSSSTRFISPRRLGVGDLATGGPDERRVAGILLTGGASRRMGRDKATLMVNDRRLSEVVAVALSDVASPVVEVGPGTTSLPSVVESRAGEGPLVAIAEGATYLSRSHWRGDCLVLACDLPHVDTAVLRAIAEFDHEGSVVPVVNGFPQPLCARWSAHALDRAIALSATERSLRFLLDEADTLLVDAPLLTSCGDVRAFTDVDTPEEWDAAIAELAGADDLGVSPPDAPTGRGGRGG